MKKSAWGRFATTYLEPLAWMAVVLAALLACGGGAPPAPQLVDPSNIALQNVSAPNGRVDLYPLFPSDVAPTVNLYKANGLSWSTGWYGPHTACGTPVTVTGEDGTRIHGRLFVFKHLPTGQGPAGRGDYQVYIPPDKVSAVSGGRRALAYEQYRSSDGNTYTAWIAVLHSSPIPCTAANPT